MQVYAFDLLPWPHVDAPSYYPDANALFDPVLGREVYAQHLDQMAMCEEYGFDAICMKADAMSPSAALLTPLRSVRRSSVEGKDVEMTRPPLNFTSSPRRFGA